jgi:hypothetical protein
MIFKKYEFTNEAAWQTAKASITTTDAEGNVSYTSDVNAVAEIGIYYGTRTQESFQLKLYILNLKM